MKCLNSIESFDQSRGAFFVLAINAKKGLNGKKLAKGLYEVNEKADAFPPKPRENSLK